VSNPELKISLPYLIFTLVSLGWPVGSPNSGHLGSQEHEHPAADQGHQTSGAAASHQGSEVVILNRPTVFF